MDSDNTFKRVYEVVRRIPRGRVATYGQIARILGNPRLSRAVGFALHVNPDPPEDGFDFDSERIPCHRVVNRLGGLAPAFAFGGVQRQRLLLEAEGIVFGDENVDLTKYQWQPRGEQQ